MKIEIKPTNTVLFSELKEGDCFKDYDFKKIIFIKSNHELNNAINIENGACGHFDDYSIVIPLPTAKVVIE